jgi:hypothetical protein
MFGWRQWFQQRYRDREPGQPVEGGKQFFFEKKNQKTLVYCARAYGQSEGIKVFCFFFSKKKTFSS